jgi:hypothetical protein
MAFVRRSGIYFGLGIGLVQMVAWAVFKNPWIMPAFGFGVGFISDYIALNMLFRPLEPKRYLGVFTFQGLLHAQREKITRDYAKILAEDLFSPENLFEGVLNGPGADKLYSLIAKEVHAAIDAQAGVATPIVALAVGSTRFRAMKDTAARLIIERLPDTLGVPHLVGDVEAGAADARRPHLDPDRRVTEGQRREVLDLVARDEDTGVEHRAVLPEPLVEADDPRVLQEPEELHVVDVPVGVHVAPAQGDEEGGHPRILLPPAAPAGGPPPAETT